jgi:hypothetical protein
MNNVAIGATTPLAGNFTTVKANTTIGVGAATPSASGAGITFPASQSASTDVNTLDDYEEGTFSPTLKFGSANAGMAGTFTGNYTKIGKQVTIDIRIVLSAKGSSTGIATIENLPFSGAAFPCAVIDASAGVSGPAVPWLGALGGTILYLFYQDASSRTLYTQANFTDTADLRLGLTYLV